jgi:hypothetical protein
MSVGHWWYDTGRGKAKYLEKSVPSAILSTLDSTWNDLGLNPSLCGESPVTVPWHGPKVTLTAEGVYVCI